MSTPAATPLPEAAPRGVALRAGLDLAWWRHGAWLLLVLALLAAAGALAWQTGLLQAELARPAVVPPAPLAAAPSPEALARQAEAAAVQAVRQVLVPYAESTAQLRKLVQLTQPALAWHRAEFQQSEDAASGIVRMQVTVPVSGSYPAMRQALATALREMPNLSLDQVTIRRQRANESVLESRLRFSFWLAAPARGTP